jgi:hypothetical protein
VTPIIWLASYPKSGNTWLRLLIGNLWAEDDEATGLSLLHRGGLASDRGDFDRIVLVDSGLLTHNEIDLLRPRAYEAIARGAFGDQIGRSEADPIRFVKVHDAYTTNLSGEPLLGGSNAASGAIVIVRDPRDVAPSLAHHMNFSVDDAIAFMNDDGAANCKSTNAQDNQLRQKLCSWSGHVASWLEQNDLPVHVICYEDMQKDAAGELRRALAFAGLPATGEQINRAVASSDFAVLRQQEQQKGFTEAPRLGVTFFRRGEAGSWRDELTCEQVIRIEERHGETMLQLGYELSSALQLARAG